MRFVADKKEDESSIREVELYAENRSGEPL